MVTATKEKSNSLISKIILRGLPASFVGSMTFTISGLISSLLAGVYISGKTIAAIGIAMPVFMMINSVISACGMGSGLLFASEMGRGRKENANRAFSCGATVGILLGIIACFACVAFGKPLVVLFGAGTDSELITAGANYLAVVSATLFMGPFSMGITSILRVLGKHKVAMIGSFADIIISALVSWVLVANTDLGIVALALSRVVTSAGLSIYNLLALRGTGVKWKLYRHSIKEAAELFKLGLPSSTDFFASSLSRGVVNNLLTMHLGPMAIAVMSVANSVYSLFQTLLGSIAHTAAPAFGVLNGMRDKSGLKAVLTSCFKIATPAILLSVVVFYFGMPAVIGLYNKSGVDTTLITAGVWIMIAFCPVRLLSVVVTDFFESTGRFKRAIFNGIMPDSVMQPLLMIVLLPIMGYTGLWLSVGLGYVVYLVIDYIIACIRQKTFIHSLEDYMDLDEEINNHTAQLDIAIKNQNEQITGISERIYSFLEGTGLDKKKAHHTALCLEELAVDMTEHSKLQVKKAETFVENFDIKMFVEDGEVSLMIRSVGKHYNPLAKEVDPYDPSGIGIRIVQKLAKKIEYSYVLEMNVVQIVM